MGFRPHLLLLPWLLLSETLAVAQVFDERFDDWPLRTSISGTVIIGTSLTNATTLSEVLGDLPDNPVIGVVSNLSADAAQMRRLMAAFAERDVSADVQTAADSPSAQLKPLLAAADVLCWMSAERLNRMQLLEVVELKPQFEAFMKRGATLVLIGPHCEIAAKCVTGNDISENTAALDLIPDSLIHTGPLQTDSAADSPLLTQLTSEPRTFGIDLSATGLLVLRQRTFRFMGPGSADFLVPECEWLPTRRQTLRARTGDRQDPGEYLVDLTEWRREAIDRTLEPFPPAQPAAPQVENGTLVIVGGGGMPAGLMQRFIELAGGTENARLVYVPCAEQPRVSPKQRIVEAWQAAGVSSATFIHTKNRLRAHSDEEFLMPLRDATGIWFGGGRQWNFSDSYYGTTAHKLMKDVLKRGGVIGGSSAGASIQARYLARATPIQNFRIMAPGYERGGLGFISGVAIDQHFTQRGRQKDMTLLVDRYPALLGIGIDEATALIVQGTAAEVVGQGQVCFYDRRQPVEPGQPDYMAVSAGTSYDLRARKVISKGNSE